MEAEVEVAVGVCVAVEVEVVVAQLAHPHEGEELVRAERGALADVMLAEESEGFVDNPGVGAEEGVALLEGRDPVERRLLPLQLRAQLRPTRHTSCERGARGGMRGGARGGQARGERAGGRAVRLFLHAERGPRVSRGRVRGGAVGLRR